MYAPDAYKSGTLNLPNVVFFLFTTAGSSIFVVGGGYTIVGGGSGVGSLLIYDGSGVISLFNGTSGGSRTGLRFSCLLLLQLLGGSGVGSLVMKSGSGVISLFLVVVMGV